MKALDDIYKIYKLLHRSKFKNLTKFRQKCSSFYSCIQCIKNLLYILTKFFNLTEGEKRIHIFRQHDDDDEETKIFIREIAFSVVYSSAKQLWSSWSSLSNASAKLCKGVHCIDLGESVQTHIFLQNSLRCSRERALRRC